MATYTDTSAFDTDFWVGDNLDPNVLEKAATYAYGYINSQLSGRYSVPFDVDDPPDEIVLISDALTGGAAKALIKNEALTDAVVREAAGTVQSITGGANNLLGWNPFRWLQQIKDNEAQIAGATQVDGNQSIMFKAT